MLCCASNVDRAQLDCDHRIAERLKFCNEIHSVEGLGHYHTVKQSLGKLFQWTGRERDSHALTSMHGWSCFVNERMMKAWYQLPRYCAIFAPKEQNPLQSYYYFAHNGHKASLLLFVICTMSCIFSSPNQTQNTKKNMHIVLVIRNDAASLTKFGFPDWQYSCAHFHVSFSCRHLCVWNPLTKPISQTMSVITWPLRNLGLSQ